jgi:hypothetical protein
MIRNSFVWAMIPLFLSATVFAADSLLERELKSGDIVALSTSSAGLWIVSVRASGSAPSGNDHFVERVYSDGITLRSLEKQKDGKVVKSRSQRTIPLHAVVAIHRSVEDDEK